MSILNGVLGESEDLYRRERMEKAAEHAIFENDEDSETYSLVVGVPRQEAVFFEEVVAVAEAAMDELHMATRGIRDPLIHSEMAHPDTAGDDEEDGEDEEPEITDLDRTDGDDFEGDEAEEIDTLIQRTLRNMNAGAGDAFETGDLA